VHLARVRWPVTGFDVDGLVDALLADMERAG